MEGPQSGAPGPLEVGPVGVAGVGGLGGCAVQTLEGEIKDAAVGLASPSVGRGHDQLEVGADSEAIEDRTEAVVEVGEHREAGPGRGCLKKGEHIGEEGPGLRGGVVVEEALEQAIKATGGLIRGCEGGGLGAERGEGVQHEIPPPGSLGGMAERVKAIVGLRSAPKGAVEGFLQSGRREIHPEGGEVAGVDLAHRFGGVDKGSGGIQEECHGPSLPSMAGRLNLELGRGRAEGKV